MADKARPAMAAPGGAEAVSTAAIQAGGYGMERDTNIPRELSLVLQALIIMFIAVRGSFHFGRKEGRPKI